MAFSMPPQEYEVLKRFIENGAEEASIALVLENDPSLRGAFVRLILPDSEPVHCIAWEGKHYITEWDTVRLLRALIVNGDHGSAIDAGSPVFTQHIYSALWDSKQGSHCFGAKSINDLLFWLCLKGVASSLSAQTIFAWDCMDFFSLAANVGSRLLDKSAVLPRQHRTSTPVLGKRPSEEQHTEFKSALRRYLEPALQPKAPRAVPSESGAAMNEAGEDGASATEMEHFAQFDFSQPPLGLEPSQV